MRLPHDQLEIFLLFHFDRFRDNFEVSPLAIKQVLRSRLVKRLLPHVAAVAVGGRVGKAKVLPTA